MTANNTSPQSNTLQYSSIHDYGTVWGNINSGPGTQYNFHGQVIYVNLETARKVAQHQPHRDPATAIGRTAELTALRDELQRYPCVAITGVGGIGKSTFAAMLGAEPAAYTHRCWRNLSEIATDFSAFIQAALATLGLTFDPREMPQPSEQAEYLAEILAANPDVRLFIVLDNFESVINADGSLALGWAELLDRATHNFGPSRLLITSREQPHLPQGQEPHRFSLPGLSITDGLALLQQLKITADPSELESTVTRSGGHPLALRFLADLITNEGYTLAQLLHEPIWDERIAERLLDKIYQSLPFDQQQTLGYFSLFDRPTTPATIAGTLTNLPDPPRGWDEKSIRRHANALVTRSLLDAARGRYTIHPIVRTYAHDQLSDPPTYHRAVASYFQQAYFASHPDAHTHPALNLADVQPLLTAFDQLCAAGDYQAASDLLNSTPLEFLSGGGWLSLDELLSRWSDFSRELAMLERLVNAPDGALRDRSRAVALGNLGIAYNNLGEFALAIEVLSRRLAIAEQIGDRQGQAAALGNLGNAYYALGEYALATQYHSRSLEIKERIGDRQGQANSFGGLGNAYQSLGEFALAIEFDTRSLALKEELGDVGGQARSFTRLGNAYHSLGEYDKAIDYHSRALKLAEQIGDRQGQAAALGNLGNAYYALGEYALVTQYHSRHLKLAEQIGDVDGMGIAWNNLGSVLESLKRYRDAAICYLKALPVYERIRSPYITAARNNIARLRATIGEAAWPALEAEARLLAADPAWRPELPEAIQE